MALQMYLCRISQAQNHRLLHRVVVQHLLLNQLSSTFPKAMIRAEEAVVFYVQAL